MADERHLREQELFHRMRELAAFRELEADVSRRSDARKKTEPGSAVPSSR